MQCIISDLRQSDLLCDDEQNKLRFKYVHLLAQAPYHLRPVVLPSCFFSGQVRRALETGKLDGGSSAVAADAVDLLLMLTHKLGFLSQRNGRKQQLYAELARCRRGGGGLKLVNRVQNTAHANVRCP